MATLEEITQQFEDALGESTGTTIEPGTITPQGITSSVSGKKKLSWPEIVEKINEGIGLRQNEILPEVPQGVSAQKFYRTAAKEGLLPSGISTFTSSPFGSFQNRIGVAQGIRDAVSEVASTPAVESVTAPKSVIQTQREVDEGGIGPSDEATNYALPIANPDVDLATLALMFVSPGKALSKMAASENVYTTLDGYQQVQIEDMHRAGYINDAQLAAFQQGITHMNERGEPVDPDTGKVISLQEYDKILSEKEKNSWISKAGKFINNFKDTGNAFKGGRQSFTPGHQKDGTYITPYGQTVGGGTYSEFQDLIGRDLNLAISYRNGKGVGGLFGLSPTLSKELDEAIAKAPVYSRDTDEDLGGDFQGGSPLGTETMDASSPAGSVDQGDVDEDIGTGFDADQGYDGTFDGGGYGGIDFQEGGQVPQGAEADMSNLGMINEQAAQPQQGGAVSVKDDIPREADAGDYILPYETVLLVGLKDLNRYAKEAIDLAMENGVNLKGTDLDPSDDVPIKVSNYEYHIPKMLVPFFGGGKKYLDKIRQEGLDLRTRLEEEKQPSMQEQQPMAEAVPAPAPTQEVAAPQAPMMQQGGFVDDPQKKQMQTSAAVLEADASQQSPSAYNQMQALERTRRQAQQPPMVDPMGRVVQQGFAAPQGYSKGSMVGLPMTSQNMESQVYVDDPDVVERQELLENDQTGGAGILKDIATIENMSGPSSQESMTPEPDMPPLSEPVTEISTREQVSPGKGFADPVVKSPYPDAKEMQDIRQKMDYFKKLGPVKMMALIALGEARGEERQGMQAVMHVINNRRRYPKKFGKNIQDIILKKHQFSAILPNLENKESFSGPRYENFKYMLSVNEQDEKYQQALEDAEKIILGELPDITNGAVYYYNPKTVDKEPSHTKGREPTFTLGSHVFFGIEPTKQSRKNKGGFVDKVIDKAA